MNALENRIPVNRKRKIWLNILISLLFVVCLVVISAGFLLKKGVRVDSFVVGQATVSNFFLQWQDKLVVEIDTVEINEQGEAGSFENSILITNGIGLAEFLSKFFSRVAVETVRIGDLTGALYLDTGRDSSFFTMASNDLVFKSNLILKENGLIADVKEFSSKRFNFRAGGQVHLNGGEEQVTGSLSADLAGVLPVTLDFIADREQISFSGRGMGVTDDITPFVDLFGLDTNIQRWITEYLKGARYGIKIFKGAIPWNDPGRILDTFYAEARVDEPEYTFAPGNKALKPVKADYADVVFSKGVLVINPYQSTFYGQGIRAGRVEIDFTRPTDIILAIYINTDARANRDILTLLNYYNITLPFIQHDGDTETDLTLTVNLNKGQVEISGTFLIERGLIAFDGKNYEVTDTRIVLENSNISVQGEVSFEKLFTVDINGTFESQKGLGDLDISLKRASFDTGKSKVTLDESESNPVVRYHISPGGNTLTAGASSWILDSLKVYLGSFIAPFSPYEQSINLPPTQLTISPGIASKISGLISIKEQKIDIQSEILKYQGNDLVLETSGLPIAIQYDKELTFQTGKTSHWKVNNISTTLYPSEFTYADNILSMINGRMSYGDFFDSRISGQFNSLSKEGSFLLEDLHIKEKNIGDLLDSPDSISVKVSGKDDKLVINVPELDLIISTDENEGWAVQFHDLATIHKRSTLLQQYLLDTGSLAIFSKEGKKPYSFTADIPYRYSFLVEDNTPVAQLNIDGEITSEGLHATVNEKVQIQFNDQLSITAKNVGLNIPEIGRFLKDRPESATADQEKKKRFKYTFEATDSSLFFRPGAEILADRMHIENRDDKTIMRLEHGSGYAVLNLAGDSFTLEGKKLDHTFMSGLIEEAQFESGQMSMAAKGTFDKFSALIKIEDTLLKKLKSFQNILAFANTIPAFITFSLPEYNSRGLPLRSAVVGMTVEGGVATVESFEMESPELNMNGSGWINFSEKRIDMDFNLITQSKTNIKKIPLAGYILAGGEKRPSATLKVTGDLRDPEVENSMLQEVVTLPFAILLRTLALPFHLVDSMTGSAEKRQDEKSKSTTGKTNELEPFYEE
jgi:hypothetical protein